MQSCHPGIASVLLKVFQYNLCIDGNMLKPVPPDLVMEYKP